jgi:NAD(P)-dependent dehydrogenase (short-subunit alcohol dehydrogenase family)
MTKVSPATLLSRRLAAKRAFITGAASGLGLAMADLLARDGWHLGVLDIDQAALATAVGRLRELGAASVSAFPGDVASHETVSTAIVQFADAQRGLDLLVNNAGVAVAGAVEATPPADWDWIVGINLLGVVWGRRTAVPLLRRQGSGLIFNVASSAGFAAAPQMSAYNVTKAGVISLSETLAAELAGSGVQVSVAMPGFFRRLCCGLISAGSKFPVR